MTHQHLNLQHAGHNPSWLRAYADALACCVCLQTVQRTAFKPEMLAPASLQLVAPNSKRQPNRVAGTDGRAASASVQFQPKGLPTRTNAQLLGAFTNRALSPNKLCFTVSATGMLGSVARPFNSTRGCALRVNICCQTPVNRHQQAICCYVARVSPKS
jgi:hypothetical protein